MNAATLPLAREGFHAPSIEEFEWPSIVDIHVFGIDLSINRVVLQMFLVVLIVWGLFFFGFRKPKLVPFGLQNVMESVVDFVRNQIALEVIGRDGLRFVPYLTTLFCFVFLGNVGGITPPVFFPLNGRMALPAIMAICSLLLFISVGISQ
jgi:F-type H+-transporting ATPase subunit a